ncbi:MAG TPA: hypothetical protein VIY54_02740 [Steroidobacteraceae bacterium]
MAVLESILLLGLAACNSGSGPSTTGPFHHTGRPKVHAPAPIVPGQEPLTEMVSAVSASNVGPPVQLKFNLLQRPEVGQPVDLAIALVPGTPAPDSVSAQFQVTDGLELMGGAQLQQVDKPPEGAPLRHMVKILAKRDGIFAVTAVVSVVSASETATRTFSIPVIAGAGLSEAQATPPAAKPPAAKPPIAKR